MVDVNAIAPHIPKKFPVVMVLEPVVEALNLKTCVEVTEVFKAGGRRDFALRGLPRFNNSKLVESSSLQKSDSMSDRVEVPIERGDSMELKPPGSRIGEGNLDSTRLVLPTGVGTPSLVEAWGTVDEDERDFLNMEV